MHLSNRSARIPQLEIRDLRLVVAVAEEGSLTRAGTRLHITQPALSRHLKSLERRVDAALFTRTGTRMRLTASGEVLLRHARDMLARVAQAETDVRQLGATPPRLLRVGTDCYTGYHWLPAAINRFAARHPGVEIQVAFEAVGEPLKPLRAGQIDIALLTDDRRHPGLTLTRLFADELVAVVAPGHAWSGRGVVEPRDFAGERLLLLTSPDDSKFVRGFLRPAGITPRYVADVQLVGALAALAEAQFGVGVLPSWIIAPEIKSGRLVPIRLGREGFKRSWVAAVQRSRFRERSFQDFVHSIASAGNELV